MSPIVKYKLSDIVSQLKNSYKPEKIVLFGSAAAGITTKDSDFDLFLIKDTEDKLADRLQKVWHSIKSWEIPLDFVIYTPKEVQKAKKDGSVFLKEIEEKGVTLYDASQR